MTLYDIDGDKLTPSQIDFDRESKLQRLTENNLEELFNLQFVDTEFEYKRLRMTHWHLTGIPIPLSSSNTKTNWNTALSTKASATCHSF